MAKRKRTREEALDRIDDLPEISLPFHSKVPAVAHGLNRAYEMAKPIAKGLVYLDPLNLLADQYITVPIPMIAIPAHESHLLSGSPSMQIYIRAGETIVPTGGNVQDVNQGLAEAGTIASESAPVSTPRTKSAYTRRYEKAFKALKPKYVKKDGKWKKNGFKACVKAAHAAARK